LHYFSLGLLQEKIFLTEQLFFFNIEKQAGDHVSFLIAHLYRVKYHFYGYQNHACLKLKHFFLLLRLSFYREEWLFFLHGQQAPAQNLRIMFQEKWNKKKTLQMQGLFSDRNLKYWSISSTHSIWRS